jgi:hypothetical protein
VGDQIITRPLILKYYNGHTKNLTIKKCIDVACGKPFEDIIPPK